jgi:hypothetical protein
VPADIPDGAKGICAFYSRARNVIKIDIKHGRRILMKLFSPIRAPFVYASMALLMTVSSLGGQAVEPDAGAQLALYAGSGHNPGSALPWRSAQPHAASHRFTLFQADTPAAAAQASDLQVNAVLHEVAARDRRSHTLAGAAAGLVMGAGATYLLLQQGGSRSLCNRDTNQDAIYARGCHGLYAVGGAIGAGVGALIGYRIGR